MLRRALLGSLEVDETRTLLAQADRLRGPLATVPPDALENEVHHYAALLGMRITVVDQGGKVIADSDVASDQLDSLENHDTRPEIVQARTKGSGVAVRLSKSVGQELVYAARPLDPAVPKGRVVRLAAPRSNVQARVHDALTALRVSLGLGISAALILMLLAARGVAHPLRRLRTVAQEFARRNWVPVPRPRSHDELWELAEALDELGKNLRLQLVSTGTPEGLALQLLEALPLPLALFRGSTQPPYVNVAFREALGIHPDTEERVLSALAAQLPVDGNGPLDAQLSGPNGEALNLVPLVRPGHGAWWCVWRRPAGDPGMNGAVRVELARAETLLGEITEQLSDARGPLHQVRLSLDGAFSQLAPEADMRFTPQAARQLLSSNIAEVLRAHPSLGSVELAEPPDVMLADSDGMAGRAVRLFTQAALESRPGDRRLHIEFSLKDTHLLMRVRGAAPRELAPVQRLARALGSNAGVDVHEETEESWLSLPRA
jgi:hypothetical protein